MNKNSDIFGVFQNVTALRALKDLIVEHVAFADVDIIVGLDSRGFLLGPLISVKLGKPFIPIRKKGKLPGKVIHQNYQLEYGEVRNKFLSCIFLILFFD